MSGEATQCPTLNATVMCSIPTKEELFLFPHSGNKTRAALSSVPQPTNYIYKIGLQTLDSPCLP